MRYYNLFEGGRALRIAVEITILVLLLAGGAYAATLTVNASGGADYSKIQDAINNASAGDTILVYSGTYFENVDVIKPLTLKGIDNGGSKPVINAGMNGNAIKISAGNSTIDGFKAINSSMGWVTQDFAGIKSKSNFIIITNNIASDNFYGISLYPQVTNNYISGNTVSGNGFTGIGLEYLSNFNTLTNNRHSSIF
jgi:nitrous oxidase accessory protein